MSSASTATPSEPKHAFANAFALLAPHMAELDRFLHSELAAFEPEIRSMADYCIDTSGKRIRPALVFFSGWNGPGAAPSPDLVRAADWHAEDSCLRRQRAVSVRPDGGPSIAVQPPSTASAVPVT